MRRLTLISMRGSFGSQSGSGPLARSTLVMSPLACSSVMAAGPVGAPGFLGSLVMMSPGVACSWILCVKGRSSSSAWRLVVEWACE